MLCRVSAFIASSTHVQVLQQSTSTVPSPIYSLCQVRSLLQKDWRRSHSAFRRQRQDVDRNFLGVSYEPQRLNSQLSERQRHSS